MEKTVVIGGKPVRMRASALIPRLYRFKFGRDLLNDMRQLQKAYVKAKAAEEEEEKEAQLSVIDLTIFEAVAWLMVYHAEDTAYKRGEITERTVPNDPDEWLDSIDGVVSVYEIMPEIIDLWEANTATTSVPRKK